MVLVVLVTVIVVLVLVAAASLALAGLVVLFSRFLGRHRPSAETMAAFNARTAAETRARLERKQKEMDQTKHEPVAGEPDEDSLPASSSALGRYSPYLALLAAWVATCGSLFMSEAMGWVPCLLCWYQRILMYPLALITAAGLLRRDRQARSYILILSVPGIFMSAYHYLYQKTDLFRGLISCTIGVPCSADYLNWLGGVVTIPFLALMAFLIITFATVAAGLAPEPEADADQGSRKRAPVWAVLGIAGAVMAAFLIAGASVRNSAAASTPVSTSTSASTSASTRAPAVVADPAVIARGKALNDQAGAACHGQNGAGTTAGRPLTNSVVIKQGSDSQLIDLIRAGRAVQDPHNTTGLAMPAGGGRSETSAADLVAIIGYLRTLAP